MEPVFDRLGMVLVSSNIAQGGIGTLQTAMAGTGIYGSNDFVVWDSSMTEKDNKAQDVFFRQALLAGAKHNRVPILFDMGGGKGTMEILHRRGAHIGGALNTNILPKFKNTVVNFAEKKVRRGSRRKSSRSLQGCAILLHVMLSHNFCV